MEILSLCFKHITMVFWGVPECYMLDVVPTMLAGMKGEGEYSPFFVWSSIEAEAVDFEDGSPISWRMPLEKAFHKWPCWNYLNTVIY